MSVGRPSPLVRALDHHIRVMGGCDLGEVVVSSIFGLIRGSGTVTVVLPTFVLVSNMHLAQQYRDNDTSSK